MTPGALSCLDRCVQKLLLEHTLEIVMAVETPLAFCIGFQPELVLRVCDRREAQTHNHKEEDDLKPQVHVAPFPFHRFPAMWHSSHDLDANTACIVSLKNLGSLEA